jgi:DNA-directed RNA polymerase specialized sigma subunit
MTVDVQKMLKEDVDYINIKRYSNSIAMLEVRYPEGCPDHIIAQALDISEKEVEARYKKIITRLRRKMRV